MRPYLAQVLIALSACSPTQEAAPNCISQCGALLFGSDDCAGFQNAETVFRSMGALHTEYSSGESCARLSGWEFHILRAGSKGPGVVEKVEGGTFTGRTFCSEGVVQLGTDDWSANAYAHEAFHVVEQCAGAAEGGHVNWDEKGFNLAINATMLKCGGQ